MDLLKKFRRKPTYTHKDAIINVTAAYWIGLLMYKLIAREWYTIDQFLERLLVYFLVVGLIVVHYFIAKWHKHNITLSTRIQNPNSLRLFLFIVAIILVVLDVVIFSFIV